MEIGFVVGLCLVILQPSAASFNEESAKYCMSKGGNYSPLSAYVLD